MKRTFIILFFILVAVSVIQACHYTENPDIAFEEPHFFASTVAGAPAAAFMKIVNSGAASDALTGCSLKGFPSVRGELHDVIDGAMTKIDKIPVPANDVTELKKGSLHMMFFDMPEEVPHELTITLQFQKSGTMTVKVPVSMRKGGNMKHEGHMMHGM
jgi:copper(I)-binding protein